MKKVKNMEFAESLIGAKLSCISDEKIVVIDTNGKQRVFNFIKDDGDWCGFAEVNTHLYITQDELNTNPVITNVKTKRSSGEENESDDFYITLCGINKKLAKVSCRASSGSGWGYGATVTIRCKALNINDVLCEY